MKNLLNYFQKPFSPIVQAILGFARLQSWRPWSRSENQNPQILDMCSEKASARDKLGFYISFVECHLHAISMKLSIINLIW